MANAAIALKTSGKAHTRTKAEAFMRCKIGKDKILYIMNTTYKPGQTIQKWFPVGKLSSEQSASLEHYDALSDSFGTDVLTQYRK